MSIVNYSDEYRYDVVRLVEEFHKEALNGYDEMFNAQSIFELIGRESESNGRNAYLLVVDGICRGILFGLPVRSRYNDKLMFQEIIWYVDKEYRRDGIRLLREAEKDLKARGFSIMIMAVMENLKTDKIKSLYERLGYRAMETSYMRTL